MSTANQPLLAPGWWAAVNLKQPISGSKCYVGKVQAVTDAGVRLTLIDWLIGMATGYDLLVPWDNIDGALVATDEHDLGMFGDEAGQWQTRSNDTGTAETSEKVAL